MKGKVQISAAIVLYNENLPRLQNTVNSFLELSLTKKLFLIDNSANKNLQQYFKHPDIAYIFTEKNIGFGSAHNLIINNIEKVSSYHLILNPDVLFKPEIIVKLIAVLQENVDVAMISPKVLYPNGQIQYTCRKYPNFWDLVYRRLGVFKTRSQKNEYRNLDFKKPFFPDFIHGCFMLFNTQDFIAIQGFDERFFLYMEDVDICRKIDEINKRKMYYPEVTIEHQYQKGSAKKMRLLYYHFLSAIKYFKKWKN